MQSRKPNYRQTATPISPELGMVVDLSAHANKLMAYEDISADLTDEQEDRLVDYVRNCVQLSHSKQRGRYQHWLEADRAHDVYVPPDATEFREKAVISTTRAVADTVVTYLMAALAGRNPMFQLIGEDPRSRKSAAIHERLIHRQLRRGMGEFHLAQMFTDMVRYGMSPTQIAWDGLARTNDIINRDPRLSFHDPRVQWGEWDKMRFHIFADWLSYDVLEASGLYPKLKHFPAIRFQDPGFKVGWDGHRHIQELGRGLSINPSLHNTTGPNQERTGSTFVLGSQRITNHGWFVFPGFQLGFPQADQIWMELAVIDESICIGCRLSPHGRTFPRVMGGLFNDAHKSFGQSLYDLLLPMHDIATWLLRSRVDNVQATLSNLIFADPQQVSVPDIIDRNPWGLVPILPGGDVDSGLKIVPIPDITGGHWNDIAGIEEQMQRLSAASDAQQGLPTTGGVRSATEVQRMTQLGSQRLGVLSRIISAMTIRPMVRMMVANNQDFFREQASIAINEDNVPLSLRNMVKDGYLDFTIEDLAGDIDYNVVDGTLPIEPTRDPQTWLQVMQAAQMAGLGRELDIRRMGIEAIRSLGVPDVDQFRIDPREPVRPSQQLQMMEKMRGATVAEPERMMRQVEAGNLIPANQSSAA
mgnify:FL=1